MLLIPQNMYFLYVCFLNVIENIMSKEIVLFLTNNILHCIFIMEILY